MLLKASLKIEVLAKSIVDGLCEVVPLDAQGEGQVLNGKVGVEPGLCRKHASSKACQEEEAGEGSDRASGDDDGDHRDPLVK